MNTYLFANQNEQISSIVTNFSNLVTELLKNKSHVTIAVSGGKSPIPLFEKLRTLDLPWDKVTITLVDDRVVDSNHPDSNANLVKTHLLQDKALKAKFVGLSTNSPHELKQAIDIAILGIGEDGHTASIFPDCKELPHALDLKNPHQYIITNPTSAKYQRISLTLKGIIEIPHLLLSINGDIKFKVLLEAMRGDNLNYPISYVIPRNDNLKVFWYEG